MAFFKSTSYLLALLVSTVVFAAPTPFPSSKVSGCSAAIATATLKLPTNQTVISVPAGVKPIYIALGVGTQNYTCSAAGTYTSAGAVAKLFDISCMQTSPLFPAIQDLVFAVTAPAKNAFAVSKIESVLKSCPTTLGDHYFIAPANSTALSPVFDFRAGALKGNANGFVTVKKLGNTASPGGAANVDWLELANLATATSGTLATNVFRVDTKGGQPPASCAVGSAAITVAYTAKYWFFK